MSLAMLKSSFSGTVERGVGDKQGGYQGGVDLQPVTGHFQQAVAPLALAMCWKILHPLILALQALMLSLGWALPAHEAGFTPELGATRRLLLALAGLSRTCLHCHPGSYKGGEVRVKPGTDSERSQLEDDWYQPPSVQEVSRSPPGITATMQQIDRQVPQGSESLASSLTGAIWDALQV